jgi:hypothetical protein
MKLQIDLFRLQRSRVLVLGDVMLDVFCYGDVGRISPEAPIPVLRSRSTSQMAGGAALTVDLLDRLVALSGLAITVEPDPARMRPSDTPRFVSSTELALRLLGWSPEHRFDETLAAVLKHSRAVVSGSAR